MRCSIYRLTGGCIIVSGGNTSNTELTLTGLTLGSHSIFVVSFGAEGDPILPRSETVPIIIGLQYNTICVAYYVKVLFCTDIPQIPSVPTLELNSSSIIVSWSLTLFPPVIYRISFSCQLVCGLSAVTHQTPIVDGELTTYTITTAAVGNNCSISVTAIFGINHSSNTITSSTITTSAGTMCMYMH